MKALFSGFAEKSTRLIRLAGGGMLREDL